MEQMSLFDFANMAAEEVVVLGKVSDDREEANYLQRGEKILSLLREKKHREFIPSGLFEAVNIKSYHSRSYEYNKVDYLLTCASKVLRQKWKNACTNEDFESFFSSLGLNNVTVKILDETDSGYRMLKIKAKKQRYEGGVMIKIGDKELYAPMGDCHLSKRVSGRSWRFTYETKYYRLCDVSMYFNFNYLLHSLQKKVREEISDLSEEMIQDNRIADFLWTRIRKAFELYTNEDGMIRFRKETLEIPCISEFIKSNDLRACVSDTCAIYPSKLLPLMMMCDTPLSKDFVDGQYQFVCDLFELLYEVYSGNKKTDRFLKTIASEYAKSYQTKKAIPEKVIKAMSKSRFNDYFGYVEFDAETDLAKVKEIELEFMALQKAIFHQDKRKEDVSLRFRKLGHHHATGLYYPYLKCLCVDIRCPSSMAHEYGHMLDHENGQLSKGVKFSEVRSIYTELLTKYMEQLPKDDPLKIRLMGHTKYNKDYYLEPTEIFARALEIYLVRIVKIDNSLVKPDSGFAYPKDEKLLSAIEYYFNEFFGISVKPAAKKAAAANN